MTSKDRDEVVQDIADALCRGLGVGGTLRHILEGAIIEAYEAGSANATQGLATWLRKRGMLMSEDGKHCYGKNFYLLDAVDLIERGAHLKDAKEE